MKIIMITLAYNEEKRLPFLLRHYEKFVDQIIVYYNAASTDKTLEILEQHPLVKIISFDTGGYLSEERNLEIKNTAWKNLDADWFIVIDADEYLYHEGNMRELLENLMSKQIRVPHISGYQMIGEPCPEDDGKSQIYDFCKYGTSHYTASKQVLFAKGVDIKYGYGGHTSEIMNDCVINSDLKLLHYRFFSYEYMLDFYNKQNLNPDDKRTQYFVNLIKEKSYYDELYSKRERVIK